MMNSLWCACALALSALVPVGAAHSQCDSVRQNESKRSAEASPSDIGENAPLKDWDLEKSSKGGYRVQVYLCNGSMMYGDLLNVHGNILSMYAYSDFSYSRLPHMKSGIYNFDLKEINKVVVKGQSKILQGIFIGFLGGMLTGAVMTRIVEQHTPADNLFGPGALGGIGLMVGGTIGYLSSGGDLEITNFEGNNLILLKVLSRYPKNASQ